MNIFIICKTNKKITFFQFNIINLINTPSYKNQKSTKTILVSISKLERLGKYYVKCSENLVKLKFYCDKTNKLDDSRLLNITYSP